jgi:nitrogenase molybdenum-cofactor synthesis protein NifE
MDIKDLYDEPACSRNNIKDATCEKSQPGDSSTKCAFAGAQFALYRFSDCVHIMHSPSTCQNIPFGNGKFLKNSLGDTGFMGKVFSTDMSINDIVFGGDKKLRDSIDYVMKTYSPKGVFLYTTCVSALIGEDISAIAKDKGVEYDIPVIAVHSPGFIGNDSFGAKVAGISVLEELAGKKEPEYTTDYDVNLIGEYNSLGDM